MCLYLNIRSFVGRNIVFFFSFVRVEMYYIAAWCLAASPESKNTAQLFFQQEVKVGLKSIVNLQPSAETLHISRVLIPIITEWQWYEIVWRPLHTIRHLPAVGTTHMDALQQIKHQLSAHVKIHLSNAFLLILRSTLK